MIYVPIITPASDATLAVVALIGCFIGGISAAGGWLATRKIREGRQRLSASDKAPIASDKANLRPLRKSSKNRV